MDERIKEVAARVGGLREVAGLDQEVLAGELGVTRGRAQPGRLVALFHPGHHGHAQDGAARLRLTAGPHPHRPLRRNVREGGLHLTVADTGWAKSAWGKICGQWLSGAAVFVHDMDKFVPGKRHQGPGWVE